MSSNYIIWIIKSAGEKSKNFLESSKSKFLKNNYKLKETKNLKGMHDHSGLGSI